MNKKALNSAAAACLFVRSIVSSFGNSDYIQVSHRNFLLRESFIGLIYRWENVIYQLVTMSIISTWSGNSCFFSNVSCVVCYTFLKYIFQTSWKLTIENSIKNSFRIVEITWKAMFESWLSLNFSLNIYRGWKKVQNIFFFRLRCWVKISQNICQHKTFPL